jgi:hypothetical protein
MRELSMEEVGQVNGGMVLDAAPFFTTMVAIGVSTFGSTWGAAIVGSAILAAPIAVGTMAGLSFLGGVALTFR